MDLLLLMDFHMVFLGATWHVSTCQQTFPKVCKFGVHILPKDRLISLNSRGLVLGG